MTYHPMRSCPCVPGDDWPECSTHGIVAKGGTAEDQWQAVLDRDGEDDSSRGELRVVSP